MLDLQEQYKNYMVLNKSQEDIDALIADLGSENGVTCKKARTVLLAIGEPAVDALIEAFQNKRENQMHWEAAKALSQIGSPQAIEVFIEALRDDNVGVRWLAAEGLIAIGQAAIMPLLQTLQRYPRSTRLRVGALHILQDLTYRSAVDISIKQQLSLVLNALDDIQPALSVPIAAHKAMHTINSSFSLTYGQVI